MASDIKQKTALVTGAARGIGKGFAQALAEFGAAVAVADLNASGARATSEELRSSFGVRSLAIELDVTDFLAPGANEISAVVVGTLKNTLGPHHNNPPLGRAWPNMFQQGASGGRPGGAAYHVVPYGLFGDLRLVRRAPK